MSSVFFLTIILYLSSIINANESDAELNEIDSKSVYDFTVNDLEGNEIKLEEYRGKILLIVNVASECGYTESNYEELNDLHHKYSDKAFAILAFPCNQFGGQEPGDGKTIKEFLKKKHIAFDVFSKIEVNGENEHPLFAFLKKTQKGNFGDFIKWNFTKFLTNKSGQPVQRYSPSTLPKDIEKEIRRLLFEKEL